MATMQPQSQDQSSPGLTISLSSNNPFRNRAASPLPKSPASPFDDPAPPSSTSPGSRPLSNNPFLDPNHRPAASPASASSAIAAPPLITMADEKETKPAAFADDLFASLSLDDKDKGKTVPPPTQPAPGARRAPPPPRGENVPPGARRGPPPTHRSRPSGPPGAPNNSPPRRSPSGAGRTRGPERPMTEEEKKKKREYYERKRREEKKKVKAHRDHDLIDKLDETNPFGISLVHHSGPYDAVNPSRNKATNRHAPMSAFPKDSVNMSMGGSGPLNKRPDHATFMGNNDGDATADYGVSAAPFKQDVAMFDPHQRASVIHGDESVGLGTSTFLEGTPAAKAALEKAQQESREQGTMEGGGLGRKKSLAQRIGINRPPRAGFNPSGRMTNPEGAYYRDRPSAGSMSSPRGGENNPFFSEYEPTKDGEEQISVRRTSGATGPGDAKSPLPGSLERRATTDSLQEQQSKPKGGLLGRMKSLKGGPRSRPVDKDYV